MKNERGFIVPVLVIILSLLIVGAVGGSIYTSNKKVTVVPDNTNVIVDTNNNFSESNNTNIETSTAITPPASSIPSSWKTFNDKSLNVSFSYPSYFSTGSGAYYDFAFLRDEKGNIAEFGLKAIDETKKNNLIEQALSSVKDQMFPSSYGMPATLTVAGKTFYRTYASNAHFYWYFKNSNVLSVAIVYNSGTFELSQADIERMLGSINY